MIWQQLVVAGVVLTAVLYLVWQSWRTWFGTKSGCAGGCHCASKKNAVTTHEGDSSLTLVTVDELTQRLRGKK